MQLRGEISYWTPIVAEKPKRPIETDEPLGLPYSEDWHFVPPHLAGSPEHEQLAAIRAHCIDYPEAVLLDVYQKATVLSLDPSLEPNTFQTQQVLLDGLRGETTELSSELKVAQVHHPYNHIMQALDEDEDAWLHSALPFHHLRFFQLQPANKEHYLSEAGDALWYAGRVAEEMGTSLSGAFFKFMQSADAGRFRDSVNYFGEQAERERFAKIMDFDLVQTLSLHLADKAKVTLNRGIPGLRHEFTVEDNPTGWLDALVDREMWPDGVAVKKEEWDPATPYNHLPDLELAIGKLVWFTAYTSHTILNTDFRTVMQGNLQKNVLRSKHRTVLSREGRTDDDEPAITASQVARMPLQTEPAVQQPVTEV